MLALIDEVPQHDMVINFLTTEISYVMYTERGRRLDIRKCHTFTPPIEDEQHYPTYMFCWAVQGYFILRQELVAYRAGPWTVVREIVPRDSGHSFFDEFSEVLEGYLLDLESKFNQAPSSSADSP